MQLKQNKWPTNVDSCLIAIVKNDTIKIIIWKVYMVNEDILFFLEAIGYRNFQRKTDNYIATQICVQSGYWHSVANKSLFVK